MSPSGVSAQPPGSTVSSLRNYDALGSVMTESVIPVLAAAAAGLGCFGLFAYRLWSLPSGHDKLEQQPRWAPLLF